MAGIDHSGDLMLGGPKGGIRSFDEVVVIIKDIGDAGLQLCPGAVAFEDPVAAVIVLIVGSIYQDIRVIVMKFLDGRQLTFCVVRIFIPAEGGGCVVVGFDDPSIEIFQVTDIDVRIGRAGEAVATPIAATVSDEEVVVVIGEIDGLAKGRRYSDGGRGWAGPDDGDQFVGGGVKLEVRGGGRSSPAGGQEAEGDQQEAGGNDMMRHTCIYEDCSLIRT